MQQAESLSLDEIESFLDGCGSVEFQAGSRADKYALVEGVLKRHHYADQKRSATAIRGFGFWWAVRLPVPLRYGVSLLFSVLYL